MKTNLNNLKPINIDVSQAEKIFLPKLKFFQNINEGYINLESDFKIKYENIQQIKTVDRPKGFNPYKTNELKILRFIRFSDFIAKQHPYIKFDKDFIEYSQIPKEQPIANYFWRLKESKDQNAYLVSFSNQDIALYDSKLNILKQYKSSELCKYEYNLRAIDLANDLSRFCFTCGSISYLLDQNFEIYKTFNIPPRESAIKNNNYVNSEIMSDFISGIGFSSDNLKIYLGCDSGILYETNLNGQVDKIFLTAYDEIIDKVGPSNAISYVFEAKNIKYILSYYYLYILEDNTYINHINNRVGKIRWFDKFILKQLDKEIILYDQKGNLLDNVVFKTPIKHICYYEGILIIELTSKTISFNINQSPTFNPNIKTTFQDEFNLINSALELKKLNEINHLEIWNKNRLSEEERLKNARLKRLEQFYFDECPLLVKEYYNEFSLKYPNRYQSLGKINTQDGTKPFLKFIEDFICVNYNIPYNLHKDLGEIHANDLFFAPTDDFGFSTSIEKNILELSPDSTEKYQWPDPRVKNRPLFEPIKSKEATSLIKKKIKDDVEIECALIKFRLRSYLKRFFIQGGMNWNLIVADQLYYYGIDKFPNCLDHEFSSLKHSIGFYEQWNDVFDNLKKKKKLYSELKKINPTDYTYKDVLKWNNFSNLNGEGIEDYGSNIIKIMANCDSLGEIPLLILNDGSNIIKKDLSTLENYKTFLNTFSNNSSLPTISQNPCINWMDKWPYQFPNIFKLDIKDVITDEKLIQEYLASYNEPENEIRAMFGLPKIGEGWISETNLFYEIKKHFYNEIVIHHGRPNWLGKQHLDIYLPKYNIGIEYQGDQHYYPIEFFGGEESFKKNKNRDEKKNKLCKDNNCHLIYVNPDYNLDDILNEINQKIMKNDY